MEEEIEFEITEESKQEETKTTEIELQNSQKFYIGQELDCRDTLNIWLNVEVIGVICSIFSIYYDQKLKNMIRVHYTGYG
jgi:hypothetical protein